MPTIRQLARLFQAVSAKDLGTAEQIAKQIANLEEKKGHRSAAQLLRGSLHSNGLKGHRVPEPISGILTNGNFLEAARSKGRSSTHLEGNAATKVPQPVVRAGVWYDNPNIQQPPSRVSPGEVESHSGPGGAPANDLPGSSFFDILRPG